MTSDLSDALGSFKLNDERIRLPSSTGGSGRRALTSGHRHGLHAKRAATIDPESSEEKLRIVVLGATKVGRYKKDNP